MICEKCAWLFTYSNRVDVCLDNTSPLYVVHDVMCVVTTTMRTLNIWHEVRIHCAFVLYCLRLYETCTLVIAIVYGSSTLLLSPFSCVPLLFSRYRSLSLSFSYNIDMCNL